MLGSVSHKCNSVLWFYDFFLPWFLCIPYITPIWLIKLTIVDRWVPDYTSQYFGSLINHFDYLITYIYLKPILFSGLFLVKCPEVRFLLCITHCFCLEMNPLKERNHKQCLFVLFCFYVALCHSSYLLPGWENN